MINNKSAVMCLNLIPGICVSIDSVEDEEAEEIPVPFMVEAAFQVRK